MNGIKHPILTVGNEAESGDCSQNLVTELPRTRPDRPRVLLVEDSVPVRRRIRSLIEESASAEIVGEAGTCAEALALFYQHQPDAVVLDLRLGADDGYDVLAEIKRTRPACVVLVLTNFATPEHRQRCLQLRADYFLDKSREFERVPELLAELGRRKG